MEMKKFFRIVSALILASGTAFAQGRVVTGDTFPGAAVEKNYLQKNPDAEIKSVLGWTRYVDSGSRPTDGIAGSPTSDLTWTVSATNPLSGGQSFLITKAAANTQGAGVAFDFTIDRKDRGNYLQLNLDVELVSGTYNSGTEGASPTDSDQIFYIYDVTNAKVIEPDVYKMKLGGTGISIQHQPIGFFASTDSTSYRLILHTATTSASAYTIKLDNFKLSRPTKASYTSALPILAGYVKYTGAAGCDWNHSTGPWADFPADTDCNTATYVTTDNMVVNAPTKIPGFRLNYKPGRYLVIATLTSFRGVNGTYDNYLRLSDGSQSSGTTLLHYGTSFISYEPYTIKGFFNYTSSGDVDIRVQGGHNPNPNSASVRIIADSAGTRDLEFTVLYYPATSETPASSGLLSQVSQEVKARYTTAAGQTIDDSTAEIVDFGTKVEDTHNAVTTGASWRFTAPLPGTYRACAGFLFDSFAWSVGDVTESRLFKNGTHYRTVSYKQAESTASVGSFREGCADVELKATEYIDLRAFQNSGGGRNLFSSGTYNYIDIVRVNAGGVQPNSVLSQIGFSATVTASFPVGNNSATTIVFDSESFDTTNGYNPANGIFTSTQTGKYNCGCRAVYSSFNPGTSSMYSILMKNGASQVAQTAYVTTSPTSNEWGPHPLNSFVSLTIGDTLECKTYQNSGSTRNLKTTAGDSEFFCFKVAD